MEKTAACGSGEFTDRKRWTEAARLLHEAGPDEQVPILFCTAEETDDLVIWGLLKKVEVDDTSTTYSFAEVQRFRWRQWFKTDLRKLSDGQPLSADFIRSYAICRTPAFLYEARGSTCDTA